MSGYRDGIVNLREHVRSLRTRAREGVAKMHPLDRIRLAPAVRAACDAIMGADDDVIDGVDAIDDVAALTKERESLDALVRTLEGVRSAPLVMPDNPEPERLSRAGEVPLIEEKPHRDLRAWVEARVRGLREDARVERDGDYRYVTTFGVGNVPIAGAFDLHVARRDWDSELLWESVTKIEVSLSTSIAFGLPTLDVHLQSKLEDLANATAGLFGKHLEASFDEEPFDRTFFIAGDDTLAHYLLQRPVRDGLMRLHNRTGGEPALRVSRDGLALLTYFIAPWRLGLTHATPTRVPHAVTRGFEIVPEDALAIVIATRQALCPTLLR